MSASFFDNEKEVVPLITVQNGRYFVDQETVQWLETCEEPLSVITCAGKYRTGKSFLLNRLANSNPGTGFGVGDSVRACTKGLWIYKHFFPGKNGDKIVIIDTEGIDALDANETHDVRIFTLALLLSSTFLYNSVGAIDETQLQTLSLMTRVTENIRINKNDDDSRNISSHMPAFYWILRDFSLKIVDKNSNELTDDGYLEEALNTTDKNKSQVRTTIKNTFKTRTLITIPRPTTDDGNIQNLEDKLFAMSGRFTDAIEKLKDRLFLEINPMKASNGVVNGPMYAVLCKHYANIVETDAIPVMQDSWSLMASLQCRKLKDRLLLECKHKLNSLKPKSENTMIQILKEIKENYLKTYNKQIIEPTDDDVRQSFSSELDELFVEILKKLSKDVQTSIDKELDWLDGEVSKNPEDLSSLLIKAQDKFGEDCEHDDEIMQMWKLSTIDRVLCRWIPRTLQHFNLTREELRSELNEHKEKQDQLISELEDTYENQLKEQQCKNEEIQFEFNLNKEALKQEQLDSQELRDRMIELEVQSNIQTSVPTEQFSVEEDDDVNSELERMEQEVVAWSKRQSEMQEDISKLEQEKHICEQKISELLDKIEQLNELNKNLKISWQEGLDEAKNASKRELEKLTKETEAEKLNMKAILVSTESTLQEQQTRADLSEEREKRTQEKHIIITENHEKEIKQMRETVIKSREQCEIAQKRVLEIHKSMLEDLRTRDERAREQQSKSVKSQIQCQTQIAEAIREGESLRNNNSSLKRKIVVLEEVESEHKKIKSLIQEKDFLIIKLRSEGENLKKNNEELIKDRDMMRRMNLKMEGELAVLNAEKQMRISKND